MHPSTTLLVAPVAPHVRKHTDIEHYEIEGRLKVQEVEPVVHHTKFKVIDEPLVLTPVPMHDVHSSSSDEETVTKPHVVHHTVTHV